MELRGFDAYEIKLGDELRGERASLGKSLEDVENDLRIKSSVIVAIEECDLSKFPSQSVIPGYVRSYARYLNLDEKRCYQQFCEESGYKSAVALAGGGGAAKRSAPDPLSPAGAPLEASRFSAPPTAPRAHVSISLGTVFSSFALIATLVGLGYGGYSVLQGIQRVEIAPEIEAPDVVVEAPEITLPSSDQTLRAPNAADYEGTGALAGRADREPSTTLALTRRDGPISAIDPMNYGVFAAPEPAPTVPTREQPIDSADDAIRVEGQQTEAPPPPPEAVIETGIAVHAAEEAWVRIIDDPDVVLFQGILGPGQSFEVPETVASPTIRAGNAGGVYIRVNGITYGPIGEPGRVIKDLQLKAETIRARFPKVEGDGFEQAQTAGRAQTAAVNLD
ncbi:MAG: helix-turn-helix domain-containing protein [Pseudomonadota bacterium]